MKKILIPVTAFAAGLAAGMFMFDSHSHLQSATPHLLTDTVVIHDTLRINPAQNLAFTRRSGTLTLPVTYTMSPPAFTSSVSTQSAALTPGGDSVRLPLMTKVYTDSSFRAVVSGVCPSLDSITLYPTTSIVTRTLPSRTPSRWGLGLTLGVAATPRGISPALTLGLSYRLL